MPEDSKYVVVPRTPRGDPKISSVLYKVHTCREIERSNSTRREPSLKFSCKRLAVRIIPETSIPALVSCTVLVKLYCPQHCTLSAFVLSFRKVLLACNFDWLAFEYFDFLVSLRLFHRKINRTFYKRTMGILTA